MFVIGQLVVTQAVNETIKSDKEFLDEIKKFIRKYRCKQWGELTKTDKDINNYAVENGERILGRYETSKGNIYIITEADRSYTTILFCEEY